MRVLPNLLKNTVGVIILMSLASMASADPRIISTYKARISANTETDSSDTSGSTVNTGSTGGTGTTTSTTTGSSGSTSTTTGSGSSTTGSKAAIPAYTLPSNFNFNCNTRNPNADAIENGRRAYVRLNCTVCHSSTGHGGTMGPSLIGAGGDVAEAVSQGEEGGMPSFKKYLCPNDLADLKAYVDSLSSKASPTFTDWWVTNPPAPFVDTAP